MKMQLILKNNIPTDKDYFPQCSLDVFERFLSCPSYLNYLFLLNLYN